MPRAYVTVPIDSQVFERLHAVKVAASNLTYATDNTISASVAIGLLLDHWNEKPPDPDWLREQTRNYPRRGRPRASEAGQPRVLVHGKKDPAMGHEFETCPPRPWIKLCRQCRYVHNEREYPRPLFHCPAVVPSSPVQHKRWTKKDLLEFGWPEDQVSWGSDE